MLYVWCVVCETSSGGREQRVDVEVGPAEPNAQRLRLWSYGRAGDGGSDLH
jgi:hypothetical protein